MDFDLIENLSQESVEELYEDIASKDYLACTCHLSGYVIPDSTGEIHRGNRPVLKDFGDCDDTMNESNIACYSWCSENITDSQIEETLYSRFWVYAGASDALDMSYSLGYMHSWDGTMFGFAMVYSYCRIPDISRCSGEGWSRTFHPEGFWSTNRENFDKHCNNP